MKVLKVYLFNCSSTCETQIYCIKHANCEDLLTLKDKISRRCPLLKDLSFEPKMYWFDLENDRIMITCDDDLRFFLEESEVKKLIVDFGSPQEFSRKRHLNDDEGSESSKRIRRKLQQIDLDSDSTSMDTSDDSSKEEPQVIPKTAAVVSSSNDPIPSTSSSQNVDTPNVNILSVEILQSANEAAESNDADKSAPNLQEKINTEETSLPETTPVKIKQKKPTESNKIVISDSSSDDEEASRRNRRHSDGNYTSSYSFAGAENFNSRASYGGHYRRHDRHYSQFGNRIGIDLESTARVLQNAQILRDNAERIRQNTMRNVRNIRNSANVFPQLLSNFQAHFRPLFQAPNSNSNNQQQYTRYYRR